MIRTDQHLFYYLCSAVSFIYFILFHNTPISNLKYEKSVIPPLLNVAQKSLITKYWDIYRPPPVSKWIMQVDKLYLMQEITVIQKNIDY